MNSLKNATADGNVQDLSAISIPDNFYTNEGQPCAWQIAGLFDMTLHSIQPHIIMEANRYSGRYPDTNELSLGHRTQAYRPHFVDLTNERVALSNICDGPTRPA